MNACPYCRAKSWRRHCPNADVRTCFWFNCTFCGLLLDPRTRRGMRRNTPASPAAQ